MTKKISIAIDAMGGDNSPEKTIAGSNFIFGHISDNYNEYLNKKKKIKSNF